MEAQREKYIPQAGSGANAGSGESRPLTVSADRGCPSYSGGGEVLPKCNKPFAKSGMLKRTPPKTTARLWTRNETEHTETEETEDGISTGDEGAQCRRIPYASPLTFFSPMASTPRDRGDYKRKKSPTKKEEETLEEKEDRLLKGLFDNMVMVNSLVDRQGPYKNTANEIKTRLRELQKLCGRVMDVRRIREEKQEEQQERTPKRVKRVVAVEEKGTNTSTGGEMEGLEWDDDLVTTNDWKEVKPKSKRHRKEKKKGKETADNCGKNIQVKDNGKESHANTTRRTEQEGKRQMDGKKPVARKPIVKPEALLVEVKDRDYASVLKEVKSGLASNEVVFSKVRKTRKGDILLELERNQNGAITQIKEKVEELCPDLTLRALKESTDVIIKGLDITVEKEEVEESLKQYVKEFRIKRFWENRFGNKIVVVEVPKKEALILTDQKKIKIGWLRVPIRLSKEKKKCYRCLEYGHISTECIGQDRSRRCYNCGNEGHCAKDCVKDSICAICLDKGLANKNHRIGSKTCPSWREQVPGRRITSSKNEE